MSRTQGSIFSGMAMPSLSTHPSYWVPSKIEPPMNMIYKFELGMIGLEEWQLLGNIWRDMRTEIFRNIYADWLDEHHRSGTAKLVREDGFVPGYGVAHLKENPMARLVKSGGGPL